MDSAMTVMTAAAGLLFSMACAVLIEEVFVGGFFRLFFTPQPVKEKQKQFGEKGGSIC